MFQPKTFYLFQNAVFLSDTAENPYSSLPKYGADESTIVFHDDGQQEDNISHHSVHTEESLGFSSTQAGSTRPLQVKEKPPEKKSKGSRDSTLRGYSITKTINVPETFADEIRPPSLFSPDIPLAPSEMHGPTKHERKVVNSPSVFTASRQVEGSPPTPLAQAGGISVAQQQLVSGQHPQYVVPMNTSPQRMYITQPAPLTGYKVPGSIANSMADRNTRVQKAPNPTKSLKVTSEANLKCWRSFLFVAVFLVVILVVGSVVAAIVLTQGL